MNDQGVVDAEALIAFAPEEVREKLAPAIRACGTKGKLVDLPRTAVAFFNITFFFPKMS